MSDFETKSTTLSTAGENLRKAQEEISNLIPREEDRSRVAVLLNRVQETLIEVREDLAREDDSNPDTDSDVRPGFDRAEANRNAAHQANTKRNAR